MSKTEADLSAGLALWELYKKDPEEYKRYIKFLKEVYLQDSIELLFKTMPKLKELANKMMEED